VGGWGSARTAEHGTPSSRGGHRGGVICSQPAQWTNARALNLFPERDKATKLRSDQIRSDRASSSSAFCIARSMQALELASASDLPRSCVVPGAPYGNRTRVSAVKETLRHPLPSSHVAGIQQNRHLSSLLIHPCPATFMPYVCRTNCTAPQGEDRWHGRSATRSSIHARKASPQPLNNL
jgi:hypothetical protein